jgi:hypothetical protein
LSGAGIWISSHKSTLFHTVSHFSGSNVDGQAKSQPCISNFANETNDLGAS